LSNAEAETEMTACNPILQFGTSRFLQAHADLFVGEALARGEALGAITIVQGTANPESARRVAAFNQPGGYPVRIRGRADGQVIDEERRVTAVTEALNAVDDWAILRERVARGVQLILSNTGDRGYERFAEDGPAALDAAQPPAGFPARLLVLLHGRYRRGAAPITLMPCELVVNNGHVLRDTVVSLAKEWALPDGFIDYLRHDCVWVNSLVDRIVSEPLAPVGAVAEPYALWAVEAAPGMVLPCRHPQLVVTDRLESYERLKLFLLNLGHSYLVECWQQRGAAPADLVVRAAMEDVSLRAALETVWTEEVLPVFDAMSEGAAARQYLESVRDRFLNPFLQHRLADIAQNHAEKKRRRFGPLLELAARHCPALPQPRLRAALAAVEEQ
jgi:tagaturonate reductase